MLSPCDMNLVVGVGFPAWMCCVLGCHVGDSSITDSCAASVAQLKHLLLHVRLETPVGCPC